MNNQRQVVYTDQNGVRQVYCTLGESVMGLGDKGSVRQCRAWLSSLYHRYPAEMRYAIRESVRIESAF